MSTGRCTIERQLIEYRLPPARGGSDCDHRTALQTVLDKGDFWVNSAGKGRTLLISSVGMRATVLWSWPPLPQQAASSRQSRTHEIVGDRESRRRVGVGCHFDKDEDGNGAQIDRQRCKRRLDGASRVAACEGAVGTGMKLKIDLSSRNQFGVARSAQLLRLYSVAFQLTQKPLYRQIAEETARYLAKDMTSPDGGFYTARDAQLDGIEGEGYL